MGVTSKHRFFFMEYIKVVMCMNIKLHYQQNGQTLQELMEKLMELYDYHNE